MCSLKARHVGVDDLSVMPIIPPGPCPQHMNKVSMYMYIIGIVLEHHVDASPWSFDNTDHTCSVLHLLLCPQCVRVAEEMTRYGYYRISKVLLSN